MNFFHTSAYNDNDYVIVYSCISTLFLKKDIGYIYMYTRSYAPFC